MKLPKISVDRPVATAMIFMALLLFGLVSLKKLPLDIMPAMEMPTLTVLTVYPGASANEVEDQISRVLETQLAGVENLKSIKSTSRENVSLVSLEFNWGSDLTSAGNNTRDMLELVKSSLPDGAEDPVIIKINSSMMPVVMYTVTATDNTNGLGKIIDEKIAGPLKKVDGIGSVIHIGEPVREVKVNVDPDRLDAYNISIAGLSSMLRLENVSIPGGNIRVGINDFPVRIPSDITSTEELAQIPVTNFMGRIVRLSDVATIEDGYMESDEYARTGDAQGALIMIQKQSGENALEVIGNIHGKMKEILPTLPPDVVVTEILSQEEVITQAVKNLSDTLWWALLFVVMVVMAFLRNWKHSLIITMTIPVSLVTALIFMYAAGWTINIFSLMSLIIAVGLVVDDAIVVLENITQHIARGERPREAAVFATSEMGLAVVASTTTVVVVFIPLIFVGGVVGIFFKQLAALTTVTLVASLVVAFTLTPMVSSLMLRKQDGESRKLRHSKLFEASEKHLKSAESAYKKLLGWAVWHKSAVIVSALLLLSLAIYGTRFIGSDYIPMFDAGDIIVVFRTEVGTGAGETDRVAQQVIKLMQDNIPEIVPGSLGSISGQTKSGLLSMVGFSEGKNVGTVLCHLTLPDERDRSAKEIGDMLREKLAEIPEIDKFNVTSGNILEKAVLGNAKPIEIKISGDDLDSLESAAAEIKRVISGLNGFTDVESGADQGKQDYQVIIDRRKASDAGLNSGMIAMQVRQSIYGAEAGAMSEGGEDYDIMIRYDKENRAGIESIKDITLTTLLGTQVRLSDVAEIREGFGPLEIKRESQQRFVSVSADLIDLSLGEAAEEVERILGTVELPEGVDIELAGQLSSQKESFADLKLVLVIAVLLIYMVMAGQFESFLHPFIIMLSVPFTIVGIVAAFLLTGTTLSVTTFIGIIMLAGIVVKNGIILVDYTNMLRKRGYRLYEAIQEAGRSRLRPVVMTSSTMILAMVPMALSRGMGYEMFTPMAVTLIGGLLFSMIITLIIVPVFYAVFNRKD